MRAGRSSAAGAAWVAGASDVAANARVTEVEAGGVDATGTEATGAGAIGAEAPDWRALIAMTSSPLRILAVPVRPRPPAKPWSSASFMVLRLPGRLGVSSAPLVGALARTVVFVTKDPSPS